MQSGRLFEIVYLLMERRQMTTAELARELEVSSRTIRRDVEALSAAGIPVYMTRGKGGGVHLLPHYVLDRSLITDTEQSEILSALAAMRATGAIDDPSTQDRLARIFGRNTVDWLDIDLSFWGAPPEYKQAFGVIKDAILSHHILRFTYYDVGGKATTRSVEPMQLIFKESSWYLRAYCLKRKDWRTFKLFRINWETLEILAPTFSPRSLPPLAEGYPGENNTTHLALLFEASAEKRLREEFAPESIQQQEDDRFLVETEHTLNDRTRFYLLSYGAELEVLAPNSVRSWLKEQAKSVAAIYS